LGDHLGEGTLTIRGPGFLVVGVSALPSESELMEFLNHEGPHEVISALPEGEDGPIESVASQLGIPFRRAGLSDSEILDLFAQHVSFIDLLRLNRRRKKLAKRMRKEDVPIREQERYLRKVGGYRRFEEAREREIASRIGALRGRAVVFVDAELAEGVAALLESFKTAPPLTPEGR